MPPAWSQVTISLSPREGGAMKSWEEAFSQEMQRETGILSPAEE